MEFIIITALILFLLFAAWALAKMGGPQTPYEQFLYDKEQEEALRKYKINELSDTRFIDKK